jgi:hypothetical protein
MTFTPSSSYQKLQCEKEFIQQVLNRIVQNYYKITECPLKIHGEKNLIPITNQCFSDNIFIDVKQSPYRPWQTLRVPRGWGSKISRQSAHECRKVASPTHRPTLPPGNIPGTHFLFYWCTLIYYNIETTLLNHVFTEHAHCEVKRSWNSLVE